MLRAIDDPLFLDVHSRDSNKDLLEAALMYEGRTQIGIEMWFKADRRTLTQRDRDALIWWLKRKAGDHVTHIHVVPLGLAAVNDPLSCRTYYGDRTFHWGYVPGPGQLRVGGGVKGWV